MRMQRERLVRQGMSESALQRDEAAIEKKIELSIQKARASAAPAPQSLYQGVYYEDD